LSRIDDAIDVNAQLSEAILSVGLAAFGLPPGVPPGESGHGHQEKHPLDWVDASTASDLNKARTTLLQFYRDWSLEGAAERDACYGPVIKDLESEFRNRLDSSAESIKVLIPGAGLGRLVYDLARMGYDAEGNEISYHMLFASSHVLNHTSSAGQHDLYPWIHSFSNLLSREHQLQCIKIPDVCPSIEFSDARERGERIGAMGMTASDFLDNYGNDEHRDMFHAVATIFFIDTAPDLIRCIATIRNCLKPGGLWTNLGPLLWHFEHNVPEKQQQSTRTRLPGHGIDEPGSFELTDDEVIALVKNLGFIIERRESGIQTGYIQNPRSMLQNIYRVSHWVARKT
jgi:hypothetical protein